MLTVKIQSSTEIGEYAIEASKRLGYGYGWRQNDPLEAQLVIQHAIDAATEEKDKLIAELRNEQ
ncbi:MAG: hypothetical protein GF411_14755 [Candidatus Lokiarchaeota archaeon]|nr:hypothetical protein [Candidatus Lokiarchaeota archaeon]